MKTVDNWHYGSLRLLAGEEWPESAELNKSTRLFDISAQPPYLNRIAIDEIRPWTIGNGTVIEMIKRTASLMLSVALLTGFFFTASIKSAHAYIELGSVGFLFQMLIASAFGAVFTLKIYWRNITSKISSVLARIKGTRPTAK